MRFHTFLLKYGEIGIKGKNRHLFEDALVRQVRYALKDVDGQFDVHKSQARIYVDCEGDYDYDETVEHLKKVFGLVGICPVVRMEDKGFEELKKDVVAYMDEMYPDKNFTFKVESRRAKKSYPLNSMEISRDLGEAILYAFPESGIKVDVHHPDVMVNVEVRNEIYVHCNQLPAQLRHYPAVVRLLAAEHQYRHDGTGGVRRAEPLAATVGRGPQALSDPDAGSCEKQGVQCL